MGVMMKTLGILAVALSVTLAGCASVAATTTSGSTTHANAPAKDSRSIQEQTVDALKHSCTDLTSFTSNPKNWYLTDNNGSTAPFELSLEGGDGGYIILLVTPGTPYATISISSNHAESTNSLLYYSGCRGFTYDPGAASGTDNDGGDSNVTVPAQTNTLEVPDFRGHTEAEARAWQRNSGFSVSLNFYYGFSVYTFCQTDMIAVIYQQTPSPGTIVNDNGASVIHLDAECPPQ